MERDCPALRPKTPFNCILLMHTCNSIIILPSQYPKTMNPLKGNEVKNIQECWNRSAQGSGVTPSTRRPSLGPVEPFGGGEGAGFPFAMA